MTRSEWIAAYRERKEPEGVDSNDFLARLRARAVTVAPEFEDVASEKVARRRQRLSELAVSPRHVALVAPAWRGFPRLEGHEAMAGLSAVCEEFVRSREIQTLVLAGNTGRGKTVAATWIAAGLDSCWWISAKDVRVADGWDSARSRAAKAAVLVVDDLGREATDWASRELGDLVELRHDRGLRTVVTTNLPRRLEDYRTPELRAAHKSQSIAERYGERLLSRLMDAEVARFVVCRGPDLRGGAA